MLLDAQALLLPRPLQQDTNGYAISISESLSDPAWDHFLLGLPRGLHVQGTLWGRLKAESGWRVVRLGVSKEGQLVGGAQLLLRSIKLLGNIGFIPKGPVVAGEDPQLHLLLLRGLKTLARKYNVRHLLMEPPEEWPLSPALLEQEGFRQSPIRIEHAATLRVDLTPEPEAILAQMKSKCRYNIRLSQRKGVRVREGEKHDLHLFHRMLQETGERQGFPTPAESYFEEMWRLFAPGGHLKLFLAEVDGDVVSALLAIAFGDTVTYKRGAWSGRHGSMHPNEAMQWAAMLWAKENGYRYYDFEGIDRQMAEAQLEGGTVPPEEHHALTSFKLGFGGEIVIFPPSYDWIPNPLLRWGYHRFYPRVADLPPTQRFLDHIHLH